MGALIAARLAETLAAELMTKIEKITFWSDSTTVLHWFHQTSSHYKAFVGNRVSHTIISNLETTLGAGTVSWRLAKLRRVLAYVVRFARNRRLKKELRQTGPVTATDLRAAQKQLVKRAQVESFGEGIRCLENGQEVHKRRRIKSLDPRMEGGFLVVGGRLRKEKALPYKTRHPKIIDSHHELAQLIIEDMHCTYHNPPTEHSLNQIRQDYWIIHCR